ncbi:MAG: SAF domain-containing protein [Acidobacteriaceae bacterium]
MKKSSLSVALSALAAVAAGLFATVLLIRVSHTETIVVTQHYLAPYQSITAQDIKMVSVPADSGIVGLATSQSEVIGHFLTFPVPSGYPITAGDLSTTHSFSSFLTRYVKRHGVTGELVGMQATTIVEQLIVPGESVALLIQNRSGQGGFQTLSPVPVLDVLRGANGATLLFFVTPQDAQTVISAILQNNVQVALIPQFGAYASASSLSGLAAVAATPAVVGHAGNAGNRHTKQTVTSGRSVSRSSTKQPIKKG